MDGRSGQSLVLSWWEVHQEIINIFKKIGLSQSYSDVVLKVATNLLIIIIHGAYDSTAQNYQFVLFSLLFFSCSVVALLLLQGLQTASQSSESYETVQQDKYI